MADLINILSHFFGQLWFSRNSIHVCNSLYFQTFIGGNYITLYNVHNIFILTAKFLLQTEIIHIYFVNIIFKYLPFPNWNWLLWWTAIIHNFGFESLYLFLLRLFFIFTFGRNFIFSYLCFLWLWSLCHGKIIFREK